MSTRKILNSSLIGISLLLLWVFHEQLGSMMHWFSDPKAVTEAIQRSGLWGPVILFVLFVLQVFIAFIPGQALMVASGYIYDFTDGMLITWLSLVLGGQAAFWLARRYGRHFAEKWISPSVLDRWDKNAGGQGIGFFAVTLVLPLFPNDAMCYVAGLGKIPSRRFLIANMLGRGLASFITVFVGAYGSKIPVQIWIGVAALFVLGLIGWQIVKSRNSSFLMA
ncbi:MAG TPA: TVP38/TMEM64 family protein [Anaerolineales bacterium]|nr:TVP38/TMEM64 family protein [Anaerolineales bacterium]